MGSVRHYQNLQNLRELNRNMKAAKQPDIRITIGSLIRNYKHLQNGSGEPWWRSMVENQAFEFYRILIVSRSCR